MTDGCLIVPASMQPSTFAPRMGLYYALYRTCVYGVPVRILICKYFVCRILDCRARVLHAQRECAVSELRGRCGIPSTVLSVAYTAV